MNSYKNNKLPPVTVLMSTYNDERFIGEAIKSILRQTMPEFEFIIIDDASTDRTPIILAEFDEQDSRINIIRNPKNLGLTKSLNIGLKHARGQFIARMDGDDISHPERLERQYGYMMDNPQCYFLATEGILIGESGKKIKNIRINFNSLSQKEYILNYGSPFVHSSMMFSKKKVLELGAYDENYKSRQDLELWLRAIYSGLEICVLKEPLICFRYHSQSLSHKSIKNFYLNLIIKALYRAEDLDFKINSKKIESAVKEEPVINDYIRRVIARRNLKAIIDLIISGDPKEGIALFLKEVHRLHFALGKPIQLIPVLDGLLKKLQNFNSHGENNDENFRNKN
jgi:glycosyltransferase involved in cell wall biosynthesis